MMPPTSSDPSASCIVPKHNAPGFSCCPTNVCIYRPSGLGNGLVPTNEFRRYGSKALRSTVFPHALRIFLAATNPQYTLIIHRSISMPDDNWNDVRPRPNLARSQHVLPRASMVENASPAASSRTDKEELWLSHSTLAEKSSMPMSMFCLPPKKCAAPSNRRVSVEILFSIFLDIKCSLVIFAPQYPEGIGNSGRF